MINNSEVINKIYEYQKSGINFPEFDKKEILTDYNTNFSALDPLGIVIEKDGKIYRAVKKQSEQYFIELYKTGILQAFADFNILPKFKMTNFYIDDYPIIFEVEKLSIIRAPYWTFSMIKKEAILKTKMIEILKNFGYGLQDGHTSNATFKSGEPVFIDFGSIVKNTENKWSVREIYEYNIIPLMMLSLKDYLNARRPYIIDVLPRLLPAVYYLKSFEAQSAISRFYDITEHKDIMEKVKKFEFLSSDEIDKLLKVENYLEKTAWSNYFNFEEKCSERYQVIIDKIKKFSPDAQSFLDIAGNSGYLAYYAGKQIPNIKTVFNTDYDEMALEKGLNLFGGKNINFALLNLFRAYTSDIYGAIKSDVVTAIAMSHHILLTQGYDIDFMFTTLKKVVNKYIYIEFSPLGMYTDERPDELPKVPDFYTVEWFEEHFKKYFTLLDKETTCTAVIQGKTYPHRILFVGKIKS